MNLYGIGLPLKHWFKHAATKLKLTDKRHSEVVNASFVSCVNLKIVKIYIMLLLITMLQLPKL